MILIDSQVQTPVHQVNAITVVMCALCMCVHVCVCALRMCVCVCVCVSCVSLIKCSIIMASGSVHVYMYILLRSCSAEPV